MADAVPTSVASTHSLSIVAEGVTAAVEEARQQALADDVLGMMAPAKGRLLRRMATHGRIYECFASVFPPDISCHSLMNDVSKPERGRAFGVECRVSVDLTRQLAVTLVAIVVRRAKAIRLLMYVRLLIETTEETISFSYLGDPSANLHLVLQLMRLLLRMPSPLQARTTMTFYWSRSPLSADISAVVLSTHIDTVSCITQCFLSLRSFALSLTVLTSPPRVFS